jgi:hypothetical protein
VIVATRDRADRLAPALREALAWAAVLPVPFGSQELEVVGGVDAGNAPEALTQAGFLCSDGAGGWSFVHSIVRDAVYRELPERDRVRRHDRVAAALAGGSLQRLAPQLASAERWAEAGRAHIRLGGAALNRGQGQDAAQLYVRARGFAARTGDARLQRDAHAGHVFALLVAGALDDAHREATRLRADLRAGGDPAERLTFLSRYAMKQMLTRAPLDLRAPLDVERAAEAMAEAQPLVEHADGSALVHALAARAWLSLRNRDPARALVDAERAAALVPTLDTPELEVWVLNALGLATGLCRSAQD